MTTVHIALIEWTEDIDPMIYVGATREGVETMARAHVERVINDTVETFLPTVRAYVTGPGKEVEDFDDWYDEIHEDENVPWITIRDEDVEFPSIDSPTLGQIKALAERARLANQDCRNVADPDLDVGMSEVFEARNNAEDLLIELVALVEGPEPTVEDI